jgi:hypothetical protein
LAYQRILRQTVKATVEGYQCRTPEVACDAAIFHSAFKGDLPVQIHCEKFLALPGWQISCF